MKKKRRRRLYTEKKALAKRIMGRKFQFGYISHSMPKGEK